MVEELSYRYDLSSKTVCEKVLTEADVDVLKSAVQQQYWYQLFIDDLPMWGMVGEVVAKQGGEEEYYLYTHKQFDLSFNNDRIIEVNLTSESAVPIRAGAKISYTYGATWTASATPFQERFDKYLDRSFFEHEIHWFSVLNAFMLVLFLVGLVAMILLRTLRRDYGQFEEDIEEDAVEESGWKLIHGDVFRAPPHLVLFSALYGTGYQLAVLALAVILFAILGSYYRSRGTLLTVVIVCYVLSSVVAGYVSAGYYIQQGGKNWIKTLLCTSLLLPGTVAALGFVINFGAVYYDAQSHIPIGTMFVLSVLWTFVCLPLTTVGTILGRNWVGKKDVPCRVKPIPRQLPEHTWYTKPSVSILLGGILPFASIFIELYFLFTSFWHYKYYYVYGFLLMVYLILVVVTASVSIVSTYLMLNAEDYRWQWTSYLSGATTGLYVYLYATYYYYERTHMSGMLQTSFYFGYMLMLSISLGILCGAVAFHSTSWFVHSIYRNVKVD
eukprot:TRINITY_DN5229_c0_g1_i1.p1 TRINITY_DN5229_c0_g1~~TRINITY_DN5229_c0_g1_i1.p1  ORF type:complete len:497 (+),score=160.81 TRINITY_DN5229_c0_g1_i1:295-1785(+)